MQKTCFVWVVIGLWVCAFVCPPLCYGGYDNMKWTKMNSGTGEYFAGIWGDSVSNIYAISYENLFHFNGNTWQRVTDNLPDMSQMTSNGFASISGSSANDIFIMGFCGNFFHFNGESWSLTKGVPEPAEVDAVLALRGNALINPARTWSSSDTDTFSIDWWGCIYHYDGNAWSPMPGSENLPNYYHFYGLWGNAHNDVYAIGNICDNIGFINTLFHYDGNAWSQVLPQFIDKFNYLLGIWGDSTSGIFAVGTRGVIRRYNGSEWIAMNSGTGVELRDVWGSSPNNVYAVGDGGVILHFNGATWRQMDSGTGNNLSRIWGDENGNVFVIGKNGTILRVETNYDMLIEDSNGDKFYLQEIESPSSRYAFYKGINESIGIRHDCMLLYDRKERTITITRNDNNSTLHYEWASPNYFENAYVICDNVLSMDGNHLTIMEGSFPLPSASKISQRNEAVPQQENVLKLGALLPLSGELESLGAAFSETLALAEQDAQTYLTQMGTELTVEMLTEDSQTNPGQTWHSVQALREEGVSVFLGPQTSPSLDYMKQFADEENYLLLSSTSTVASLSIPNDNVMRCISGDDLQAAALIAKMKADGVEDVVIVSRTNNYGRGLCQAVERGWLENNADDGDGADDVNDGIIGGNPGQNNDRYSAVTILFSDPDTEIPDTVQYLQNILNEETFADKTTTGAVLIAYDEGAELMQQAAQIEGQDAIRWYGTDSLAQNKAVSGSADAAEFAARTNFTCTTFAIPKSEAYNNAVAQIESTLGYAPPALALIAYDSYQLAVRAYLEAGSDDPASMKAALENVAQTYQGITGDLTFDENGDRANGAYEYWTLVEEDGLYYWQSEDGQVWTGEPVMVSDWMIME